MEIRYDKIGTDYNCTRVADNYIGEKARILLNPQKNKQYLDIGCGTGNYTRKLSDNSYHFWGVDPSLKMLEQVDDNMKYNISWINGFSESFVLPENIIIDGCIAINTIHHWSNIQKGFNNISNIMELGGRIVIFSPFFEQIGKSWLKHYFPDKYE